MTILSLLLSAATRTSFRPALVGLRRIAARVREALAARRELNRLAEFDDRMLRDVGLTRGDLRDAVAEPLWRDPTALLVSRARERRGPARRPKALPPAVSAPTTPADAVSTALFPARSRYY